MLSEDLDKKIKEASDHYFPAYDETAWKKMKSLLDEHLPQKKDDRWKFIFLLLIVLLTAGGGYLLINKPSKENNKLSQTKKLPDSQFQNNSTTINSNEVNKKQNEAKSNTPESDNKANTQTNPKSVDGADNTDQKFYTLNHQNLFQKTTGNRNGIPTRKDQKKINHDAVSDRQNLDSYTDKNTKSVLDNVTQAEKSSATDPSTINKNLSQTKPADNNIGDTKNIAEPVKLPIIEVIPVKASAKKRTQGKMLNNLGFTLSAGPDVSGVSPSQMGKVTVLYGAGFSFNLSRRLTLRGGFYVADKIYTAGPSDYYPPKSYWTNYIDLKKVEADCKIYEVPIGLNYNFIGNKKSNMFASLGISSFFMKRESYNYHYNDLSGQYGYKSWTLRNGSNHYFSAVTLSAGYERKLNDKFSVIAEPYVKIPINGIGFGKVKLNSGGVLFSVSVKPFAQRKKAK
jgi:hypothetical protein